MRVHLEPFSLYPTIGAIDYVYPEIAKGVVGDI